MRVLVAAVAGTVLTILAQRWTPALLWWIFTTDTRRSTQ